MRTAILLTLSLLITGCSSVNSSLKDSAKKISQSGSIFLGNATQTLNDTVELTKQGIDDAKATAEDLKKKGETIKEGVAEVTQGIEKVKAAVGK